jgi:hypothetical protein
MATLPSTRLVPVFGSDSSLDFESRPKMYAPDIGIECKTDRREVLEFGPAKGALVFRSKTIHGVMKAPKAKGMAARVDAWLVNKLQADAAFKVVNVYVWLMGTRSVLDVLAG